MEDPITPSAQPNAQRDYSPLTWADLDKLPTYVEVPHYDRTEVQHGILHFGPSKFFVAHLATFIDSILHVDPNWGITAASIRTGEFALNLQRSEGLCVVVKTRDGVSQARVVGSILGALIANGDPEPIISKVADEATKIITFTVTEKGYHKTPDGHLDLTSADLTYDLTVPAPAVPKTIYGYLVRGLLRRSQTHGRPVVLMSLDNLEDNSATLRRLIMEFIDLVQPSLRAWVEDNADFPVTLVDRITPEIDDTFRMKAFAFIGGWRVRMLVGAEAWKELVVQKCRFLMPPWESIGVKVVNDCRSSWRRKFYGLNTPHQFVAILALRLGIRHIHEAMAVPAIERLVELGHSEYARFLGNCPECPEGLDAYLAGVRRRFADGSNPDTAARVAARTTEKASNRLAAAVLEGLHATGQVQVSTTYILAVWALSLGGVDEFGNETGAVDALRPKLEVLHRRVLHYAQMVQVMEKMDQHPVHLLKGIMAEIGTVLEDSRFKNLADVDAFIRRLSSALAIITREGAEAGVEMYLAEADDA